MSIDIESVILTDLQTKEKVNTLELAQRLQVPHQTVVGTMKSLEGDGYITTSMQQHTQWKLTADAVEVCQKGSPEYRVWESLAAGPLTQKQLVEALGQEVVAQGVKNGMKDKLITLKKDIGAFTRSDSAADGLTDTTREVLLTLQKQEGAQGSMTAAVIDTLKKRKLIAQETTKAFDIVKGPQYAPVREKLAADLTRKMLVDDSWSKTKFKKLNFNAQGREPVGGQLHPLLKVRQEFREIFLELGFHEMDTQQWVESSFWNFDTLFVPQQHPARDSQDTFFISKPEKCDMPDADYLKRVKEIHEAGYRCSWSQEETQRNVLRTHTTAVSSWVMYRLAQCAPLCPTTGKRLFKPGRYFSIDRVFRNEEMDKTHLCEFHQVEGVIVDRNLSLANMMHTLKQFFMRIGITDLRFKPAYNPYTEPSMEIFGYHTGLKKWMEVGNSGVFRPEMLKPMGFDDDVTALAWGLSLERPTMIKYGIKNIHELFGHKVDLRFIRRARIARY